MSRAQAKKQISLNEYKKAMRDIYSTSVNETTIDEAPMAYKSIDDIISVIEPTVEIVDIIKPIYNFKAPEGPKFGKRNNAAVAQTTLNA